MTPTERLDEATTLLRIRTLDYSAALEEYRNAVVAAVHESVPGPHHWSRGDDAAEAEMNGVTLTVGRSRAGWWCWCTVPNAWTGPHVMGHPTPRAALEALAVRLNRARSPHAIPARQLVTRLLRGWALPVAGE